MQTRTEERESPCTWVTGVASAATAAIGCLALALAPNDASGAQVASTSCRTAAGYQEFFVLGSETHIYTLFADLERAERPGGNNVTLTDGFTESVVTLTATADGQHIYYDHWEDVFDEDPFTPGPTSEFYELQRGEPLSLLSDGSGAGIHALVPTSPRGDDLRYDGGDRVVSVGGPVAVVHSVWPADYPVIGGALEVYPRQFIEGATTYVVPVGEDTYDGDGGDFSPFKYVWIEIQALDDDTVVRVDNGVDAVVIDLDRGQTWSSYGLLDGAGALALPVLQGTTVTASSPTQAVLVTASDGLFQSRFFTLLPKKGWGKDYVMPFVGPDRSERSANLYLFNPGDQPIDVIAYDNLSPGGGSFTIAPSALVSYNSEVGHLVPAGSSVRLVSDDVFWGVVAVDWTGVMSDWGFTLLPTELLDDNLMLSWAPGSDTREYSASPMYVVPVTDDSIVCADLDGDGLTDDVDRDGDGVADPGDADFDADGFVDTGCYLTSLFGSPAGLRIDDPEDNDATGAVVFATTPLAAAWGQDPDRGAAQSDLDLGYNVAPQSRSFLEPVLTIDVTTDSSVVFANGGDVTVQAVIRSYDRKLDDIAIMAMLPSGVIYVPGTASMRHGTISSSQDPQSSGGIEPSLSWQTSKSLGPGEQIEFSFDARIAAGSLTGRMQIQLQASALDRNGGLRLTASQCADVFQAPLRLALAVDESQAELGGVLRYSIDFDRSVADTAPDFLGPLMVHARLPSGLRYVPASAWYQYPEGVSGTASYDEKTRSILFPTFDSSREWRLNLTARFGYDVVVEDAGLDVVCARADLTARGASPEILALSSPRVCADVVRPELAAVLTAPPQVVRGEPFQYALQVTNSGGGTAYALTVHSTLPEPVSYVAGSMTVDLGLGPLALTDAADGDAGELVGDALAWTLGSLAPGETAIVTFLVEAPDAAGVTVSNVVEVAAAAIAPMLSNLAVSQTRLPPAGIDFVGIDLQPIESFTLGETLLVVVEVPNENAGVVTVTDPTSGDVETLTLTEFEPGRLLAGPLPTALDESSLSSPGDGRLSVRPDSEVVAQFDDDGEVVEARTTAVWRTLSSVALVDATGLPLVEPGAGGVVRAEIVDPDQNRDMLAAEMVSVVVRSVDTGDVEALAATETALASGTFATTTGLVLGSATAAPESGDGVLEARAGELVEVVYVDPNDPVDEARDEVLVGGFDLLRNDALTAVTGDRSALFGSRTVGPSLDMLGPDGIAGIGAGDDDDYYVPLVGSPFAEPDASVLADPGRPLVFYQLAPASGGLRLVKAGSSLRVLVVE